MSFNGNYYTVTAASATTNMNEPIHWENTENTESTGYCREISTVRIRKETEKQNKAIKEVVKNWMTEDVQIAVAKEAGQLFEDIQKLRKEKQELSDSFFSFKKEMTEIKKEVRAEIKSMEEMLEKYANQILRYQNMDL